MSTPPVVCLLILQQKRAQAEKLLCIPAILQHNPCNAVSHSTKSPPIQKLYKESWVDCHDVYYYGSAFHPSARLTDWCMVHVSVWTIHWHTSYHRITWRKSGINHSAFLPCSFWYPTISVKALEDKQESVNSLQMFKLAVLLFGES